MVITQRVDGAGMRHADSVLLPEVDEGRFELNEEAVNTRARGGTDASSALPRECEIARKDLMA